MAIKFMSIFSKLLAKLCYCFRGFPYIVLLTYHNKLINTSYNYCSMLNLSWFIIVMIKKFVSRNIYVHTSRHEFFLQGWIMHTKVSAEAIEMFQGSLCKENIIQQTLWWHGINAFCFRSWHILRLMNRVLLDTKCLNNIWFT